DGIRPARQLRGGALNDRSAGRPRRRAQRGGPESSRGAALRRQRDGNSHQIRYIDIHGWPFGPPWPFGLSATATVGPQRYHRRLIDLIPTLRNAGWPQMIR